MDLTLNIKLSGWKLALAAATAVGALFGSGSITSQARAGGKGVPASGAGGGAANAGTGVQVDKVTHGSAQFSRNGAGTLIRASDGAVINYRRFDIPPGAKVQFVQPSASSRVLNRIGGTEPSKIDGVLTANGVVYFVNPAGVLFGRGAVVNVGRLYAAAGSVGDGDFLAGRDHFTDLRGPVSNAGEIRADAASLVGRQVSNTGSIVAEGGLVALVAGNDVYLGEKDGSILVKIDPPAGNAGGGAAPPAAPAAPAPKYSLGASDVYALAVNQTGTIKAKDISLAAGAKSRVNVSGTLDVSNPTAGGKGGTVQVSGGQIAVAGADVNASGDAGGGTVLIGGAAHGGSPGANGLPDASAVFFAADSVVRADALGLGNGGKVVFWAREATRAYGTISARGGPQGGDGGFVETSGKVFLDAKTVPDVSAPKGAGGTWLLDPSNITIVNGQAGTGSDDPTFNATGDDSTISNGAIQDALNAGSNVTITTANARGTQAGTITQNPDAPITAGTQSIPAPRLTLTADSTVTLQAAITAPAGSNLGLRVNGSAVRLGSDRINLGGGDLRFTAPVVLTRDVVIAGGAILFDSTVSSDARSTPRALTVRPSGDLIFGDSLGGNLRPLSSLVVGTDGTTTIGPNLADDLTITATGPVVFGNAVTLAAAGVQADLVEFQGPVFLARDATVSGRIAVGFNSTVDSAPGDGEGGFVARRLTVTSPGEVTFNGVIGGSTFNGTQELQSLTADAGGLLTLNTPLVKAAGDVLLNTGAAASASLPTGTNGQFIAATITGSPQGGDLAIRTDGNFVMGQGQKLTVVGSFSLGSLNASPTTPVVTARAAGATLGDVSALGDLVINADRVTFRRRAAGQVLANDNSTLLPDAGLDFVAGGALRFNAGSLDVSGDATEIGFGNPTAVIDGLGRLNASYRTASQDVDRSQFSATVSESGSTILDLRVPTGFTPPPPPEGNTPADPRVIEPSPLPFPPATVTAAIPKELRRVREEIIITKALAERMRELGVYAREMVTDEYLELLLGRGVFNDAPRRLEPAATDFTVVSNRLGYDPILATAKQYEALFYSGGKKREKEIGEAIDKAWTDYQNDAGDKATPAGFRAFASSRRSQYPAAGYLDQLQSLQGDLKRLGLTRTEADISQSVLFQNITPDTLGRQGLLDAIRAPSAAGPAGGRAVEPAKEPVKEPVKEPAATTKPAAQS